MKDADSIYKLAELLGYDTLIREFVCYSSADELKEFIEHCERFYDCKVSD
jgi:hypothetical protein